MKENKKVVIISIIILVIILMMISIILVLLKKNNNIENNTQNVVLDVRTEEEKEKDEMERLKEVSESERIRTYIGTYFNYIENNDLESAYELLYPEFKENYFPTLEEYEKYIKEKNYPQMLAIEYKSLRTQGEYYIVTIEISDFIDRNSQNKIEGKIIVKENNYNDYYLSFQK